MHAVILQQNLQHYAMTRPASGSQDILLKTLSRIIIVGEHALMAHAAVMAELMQSLIIHAPLLEQNGHAALLYQECALIMNSFKISSGFL